jgi:hypothetical protein
LGGFEVSLHQTVFYSNKVGPKNPNNNFGNFSSDCVVVSQRKSHFNEDTTLLKGGTAIVFHGKYIENTPIVYSLNTRLRVRVDGTQTANVDAALERRCADDRDDATSSISHHLEDACLCWSELELQR